MTSSFLMMRSVLSAFVLCLFVIQYSTGKYYLVKTKDSAEDMSMDPEEDEKAVELVTPSPKTPIPDLTVHPDLLDLLNSDDFQAAKKKNGEKGRMIRDYDGNDYRGKKGKKGRKLRERGSGGKDYGRNGGRNKGGKRI